MQVLQVRTGAGWRLKGGQKDRVAHLRAAQRPGEGGGGPEEVVQLPEDMFNGGSPEAKAGQRLVTLLTQEAVRTIVEQDANYEELIEYGRIPQGMGEKYRTPVSKDLAWFLHEHPLRDSEEWLEQLLSHESLGMRQAAMRVLEVREDISRFHFKWRQLPEKTISALENDNTELFTGALSSARF